MVGSENLSQNELDLLMKDLPCVIPGSVELCSSVLSDGSPVVTIKGRILGSDAAQEVASHLTVLQNIKHDILLNLKECTFLSSIAIGMVANLAQKQHEHNFRLRIIGASMTVKRAIFILGLRYLLDIEDDLPL